MPQVWSRALQSILLAILISFLSGCALLSSGTGSPSFSGGNGSPSPTPTPTPGPTPSPTPNPTPTPTPAPTPTPTPTPGPTPTNGDLTKINHFIFMLQENRSFDTVLGHLNDYRATLGLPPAVDDYPPTASNPADSGANITPFHMTSMCIENTSAGWPTSHINFNRFDLSSDTPTMDGFVVEGAAAAKGEGGQDTVGGRVMGFYTSDDLISHYFLAATFATSDRWFAPAPVETEPNRMYMVASTSVGHAHKPTSQVKAQTIFDLLNQNGITWNIYFVDNTLDSEVGFFAGFESKYPSHFFPISQYLTDVQNGTLPQVSYIDPGFEKGEDEHPGRGTSIQVGAAFSTSLITALMNSPSWKDSAFILSFDEGGGLYDHVASMVDGQPILEMLGPSINRQPAGPGIYSTDATAQQVPNPDGIPPQDLITTNPPDPPGDFNRTGFRVPLMVVSPFSKKNYVSHTPADYTAILKMLETRFKLNSLTKRDAVRIDMSEFFDTTNVPFATPPQVPKQPTNGPCTDTPPSF